jgi:hypothetical protein
MKAKTISHLVPILITRDLRRAVGILVVLTAMLADGRLLVPQTGPARNGSATLHHLTPGRTYYWSVQAVDSGFVGSPFAVEQQFRTGSLLVNPRRPSNEAFEFTFTGHSGHGLHRVDDNKCRVRPE